MSVRNFQLRPRLVRPIVGRIPLLPVPAETADDPSADLLELNADLLEEQPATPGAALNHSPRSVALEPHADDLPAGISYHLHQQWSRVRPYWLRLREASHWMRWGPGRPTSWRRLAVTAAGVFALGAVFVTPVALLYRRWVPPVAVARVPAPVAPVLGATDPDAAQATNRRNPKRARLARQMARAAFAAGDALDGVRYYRLGRRAQRHAPEDHGLTVLTINALGDRRAAAAARRLLRDMGREARPLLAETARSHPDPSLRQRARQIVADARR
jgi:hypothetical protein